MIVEFDNNKHFSFLNFMKCYNENSPRSAKRAILIKYNLNDRTIFKMKEFMCRLFPFCNSSGIVVINFNFYADSVHNIKVQKY